MEKIKKKKKQREREERGDLGDQLNRIKQKSWGLDFDLFNPRGRLQKRMLGIVGNESQDELQTQSWSIRVSVLKQLTWDKHPNHLNKRRSQTMHPCVTVKLSNSSRSFDRQREHHLQESKLFRWNAWKRWVVGSFNRWMLGSFVAFASSQAFVKTHWTNQPGGWSVVAMEQRPRLKKVRQCNIHTLGVDFDDSNISPRNLE